ncbi:MAG TPA: hypothetical protein VHF00_01565 [Acidimicrobiales bacterium]|nr:hypothetical protein [Acidimicrobiales bacterium]
MSTLLASLAVVAVAICVLRIALSDPDQPATTRPPTDRGRRRSRRPEEGTTDPTGTAASPEGAEHEGAQVASVATAPLPAPEADRPAQDDAPPAQAEALAVQDEVLPVQDEALPVQDDSLAVQDEALPALAAVPEPLPGRRRHGRSRRRGARLRVRSALALVILITFVGVILALAVGAALTLAGQALRDAVG